MGSLLSLTNVGGGSVSGVSRGSPPLPMCQAMHQNLGGEEVGGKQEEGERGSSIGLPGELG